MSHVLRAIHNKLLRVSRGRLEPRIIRATADVGVDPIAPAARSLSVRPGLRPYCYALVAPDGQRFYIGKGTGRRMFEHVKQARRGEPGPKCERIRQIEADGFRVRYEVLGVYDTHEEAGLAERAFIACTPGLTNRTRGGELGSFRKSPWKAKPTLREASAASRADTSAAWTRRAARSTGAS